ncbi:hypothetical protein EDC94DRAFT_668195 [Helicostylum pulchrum]|nr:hypothetical protein EDC94DRAFT_668195 [Helicostylum pulchrum]
MNSIISNFTDKGQGIVRLDLKYQPGVALVTFDNVKRHNALSVLVAVIFMGSGLKSFCAGLDLRFAREFLTSVEDAMSLNQLMYDAIDRLKKLPLITLGVTISGSIGGFIHFVQTRMGVSSSWGDIWIDWYRVQIKRERWFGWMVEKNRVRKKLLVDLVVERDEDCLNESVSFLQRFLVDDATQRQVAPNVARGMKLLAIKKDSNWEYVHEILSNTVFAKL